jgi:WD40 repeat protein
MLASRVRSVFRFGEPLLDGALRGRDVLGASAEGAIVVKDSRTGRTRESIETDVRAVDASFAGDGTALLTGTDGQVRAIRPGTPGAPIPGVDGAKGAEASADGRLAAVLLDDGVLLVEVDTGRELRTFPHRGAVSAAISPEARRVVTGGADETVRVWSVGSGGLVRRLNGQDGQPVAVAYSPRGDFVASASTDGLGRVWRVENGRMIATLSGHGNQLTDAAFSTDGSQVVTASRDRTARVWRAESGSPLLVLAGHTERVLSAAFLGGAGSTIVTASPDETARVWDALIQPELRQLAPLESPVTLVAFLREGQVRAETGGRTRVLDADTGKMLDVGPLPPVTSSRRVVGPNGAIATIRGNTVRLLSGGGMLILKGHRNRVTAASFSDDGRLLVTASRDTDARIWNVATGDSVRTLQGHFGPVNDARFSPDRRWVVTAGPRTAGLWDARSGILVRYLRGHQGRVLSAGFDPTGRVVVTGGEDGTVRTYRCEFCGGLAELRKLARARLAETGRELTDAEREQYLGGNR